MANDFQYHQNKSSDKTYISSRKEYPPDYRPIRIASKVIDAEGGHIYGKEHDEIVLRRTPAGRYEIIAKFFEDDRGVFTLTIQKFNQKSGPSQEFHFSFISGEIDTFLEFMSNIKRFYFQDSGKINISDDDLRKLLLDKNQAQRFFSDNQELIEQLIQNEDVTRDVIAVGYRRKQLEEFRKLIFEEGHFEKRKTQLGVVSSEAVWQRFFEKNTWIFGYGLSFVFMSPLDEKKLEQVVSGHSIISVGKRTDALLKTQAFVSSLCFVEIKRHDTELMNSSPYRSGTWRPSNELSGGVAQAQVTVQEAIEHFSKIQPTDRLGNPTDEQIFNFQPKSVLVVGCLSEFDAENGLNENKYRSFELFRRNLNSPEIVSFDELYHRAKFIVEHNVGVD